MGARPEWEWEQARKWLKGLRIGKWCRGSWGVDAVHSKVSEWCRESSSETGLEHSLRPVPHNVDARKLAGATDLALWPSFCSKPWDEADHEAEKAGRGVARKGEDLGDRPGPGGPGATGEGDPAGRADVEAGAGGQGRPGDGVGRGDPGAVCGPAEVNAGPGDAAADSSGGCTAVPGAAPEAGERETGSGAGGAANPERDQRTAVYCRDGDRAAAGVCRGDPGSHRAVVPEGAVVRDGKARRGCAS